MAIGRKRMRGRFMGFSMRQIEHRWRVPLLRRRRAMRKEATSKPRVILRRRRLPDGTLETTHLAPAFAG